MEKQTRKILKISGIISGGLIIAAFIVIAIALNFVFTSEKLTPVVLKTANQNLNAKLDIKDVELTFFSTFPRLGLKLKDGTLVSKVIRDTMWQRTDTLLSFKKAVLVIDVMDYLQQQKVNIHQLALDSANIYAYKDGTGAANWDILFPDTTNIASSSTDTARHVNELNVEQVAIKHATVTMDDRDTHIFANLWDMNLDLKANMKKEHSILALDFKNKNVLFWQNGQLITNRVGIHLRTDIELDAVHRTLLLRDALININGTKLGVKGTLRHDAIAQTLDLDLQYGLHAPSLETVLHMIPESILQKKEVSVKGEVAFKGELKGTYGKQKLPLATLDIKIKDASARYAGLPYGIDKLEADFFAQIDLMHDSPSYLNLKAFHFKGANTSIQADMKVENLLADPDITFHAESTIDLNALKHAFPLQESISMEGEMETDLGVRCRMSSIKKRDWGRITAEGKLKTDKFMLRDTQRNFEFISNASLAFAGNEWLGGHAQIKDMILRSPQLDSDMKSLVATVRTIPSKDTTRMAQVECKMEMHKLKVALGDSLGLFCGKSSATLKVQPGEHNPSKPQIGLVMETDTLFCRMGGVKAGMNKAGIGITAEKIRDSLWMPDGIVGFNHMAVCIPECALPIHMQKTAVTVGNRTVTLRNATMRIGRSDITASGVIHDLYGAAKHHKVLRAKLNVSSEHLDCNQLIHSISFPSDTIMAETDTISTNLKLFVIPPKLDFELQTHFRQVFYEKVIFNDVHGAVDIRNQSVYLKELSMKGMGSEMNTTLVYQAKRPEQGFAGFDFRLHNINIGKLVDLAPSLDTIVPMLRSFEGTVDFNMAAAAALDSNLNIKIPTLRSAIHVKGNSLVLMDGETFAEISKKFFFKNKKKNLIDSISANISIRDGKVTIYPFEVSMDRYKAAVGGTQGLDMNFDYHISILKSPVPFKLGLNISGTLDDMKFKLGKARYKDAVTPAEIHKVDSAIVNMGRQIEIDFKKIMKR